MDIKPNRPVRVGNRMVRTGNSEDSLLADVDAAREELAGVVDSDAEKVRALVAEALGGILGAIEQRFAAIETQLTVIAEFGKAANAEQEVLAKAVNDLGGEFSGLRADVQKLKAAPVATAKTSSTPIEKASAVEADKSAKAPKPE